MSEKVLLDRISFVVRGKTFATENWPVDGWAVVKLSIADQRRLCASIGIRPEPERGANGVTLIKLEAVSDELLTEALTAAWTLAYSGGRTSTQGAGRLAGERSAPPIEPR